MKGFILLLFLVLGGYVAWHSFPELQRSAFIKWIRPHAFRLGLLFAVVVVLAYAAYLLPSFRFT